MLGYTTKTRPGLVALHDIWPGNRAGLFLQPEAARGEISSLLQTVFKLFPKMMCNVTCNRQTRP